MKPTVLVIGGGPAGLTAALRLSSQGYAVTLLDQGDRLGGHLDRLPPVLLGCQTATVSLLDALGTSDLIGFSDQLHFEFQSAGRRRVRLHRARLPGPLHTVLSLALFRGLSARDRWRALNLIERTWESDPSLPADLEGRTAEDWLAECGQSTDARAQVWNPLARFLLGDDVALTSAASLVRVLTHCFLSARPHSRLAIPSSAMQSLLVQPAVDQLSRAGVTIMLKSRVDSLQFGTDRITGIRLQGGDTLGAEWYVAAIPHRDLSALLPDRALTRYAYFEQLVHLTDSPAVSVHLWMNHVLPAPRLILFAGRTYHWMIAKTSKAATQPGALVSLVAAGSHDLLSRPDQDLLESAWGDLKAGIPALGEAGLLDHQIVREPHAFLSLRPGTASFRPLPQSPIPNLLLAGAWTDTALPAMLDSAVLSGERCAAAIQAQRALHPTAPS